MKNSVVLLTPCTRKMDMIHEYETHLQAGCFLFYLPGINNRHLHKPKTYILL